MVRVQNDPHQKTVQKVCRKLIAERKRQELSQAKLAELSGLSRTGLRHLESLETSPTLYNVLRVAKALKIPAKELF